MQGLLRLLSFFPPHPDISLCKSCWAPATSGSALPCLRSSRQAGQQLRGRREEREGRGSTCRSKLMRCKAYLTSLPLLPSLPKLLREKPEQLDAVSPPSHPHPPCFSIPCFCPLHSPLPSPPLPSPLRFCKRGQTVTLPYTGRIRSGRLGSNLEEDERKGREEERHWSEIVEETRKEKRSEEEKKMQAQRRMGDVVVSCVHPLGGYPGTEKSQQSSPEGSRLIDRASKESTPVVRTPGLGIPWPFIRRQSAGLELTRL